MKAALIAWSAVLLLTCSPARAGERLLPPRHVAPSKTSVLLLPPLDVTPDAADMLAARSQVILRQEIDEFSTRHFKVLGETVATKAAAEVPRITLDDLSARSAGKLDLLARRTGADWVVGFVVQEAKGDSSAGRSAFKVRTRVLLQVWDARRHGWLVNGPYTGEDSNGGSPVFAFKNSLDEAVKGSLGNLLGSYAPVISANREDGVRAAGPGGE